MGFVLGNEFSHDETDSLVWYCHNTNDRKLVSKYIWFCVSCIIIVIFFVILKISCCSKMEHKKWYQSRRLQHYGPFELKLDKYKIEIN